VSLRAKRLEVSYWPVGQGLFTSTQLRIGRSSFRVVYDCGVAGRQNSVEKYITLFQDSTIDLLVLSHLHLDHVSGVSRLADVARKIKAVWLPYIAPKLRLLCAVAAAAQAEEAGMAPSDYTDSLRLIANPRGWFEDQGVDRIDEIGGPDRSDRLEEGEPPRLVPPEGPLDVECQQR